MRFLLIFAAAPIAALSLAATPAAAFESDSGASHWSGGGSSHGVRKHHGRIGDGFASSDRRDRRHGFDDTLIWDDREYTGDTLFRPDSFNDWWHEHPLRNRPAWVIANQNCDRQYWMGGAWRC